MPEFDYEAMDNDGRKIRGSVYGADQAAVTANLVLLGYHPTKIVAKDGATDAPPAKVVVHKADDMAGTSIVFYYGLLPRVIFVPLAALLILAGGALLAHAIGGSGVGWAARAPQLAGGVGLPIFGYAILFEIMRIFRLEPRSRTLRTGHYWGLPGMPPKEFHIEGHNLAVRNGTDHEGGPRYELVLLGPEAKQTLATFRSKNRARGVARALSEGLGIHFQG